METHSQSKLTVNMKMIFKKEFKSFFSNITGYIVIALFVLANALFLWVLPGQWNVFDSGYASLDALFFLAPWLYLFLCPAVTMRFFAEERAEGTLELLLTKPLSRFEIFGGNMHDITEEFVWFGGIRIRYLMTVPEKPGVIIGRLRSHPHIKGLINNQKPHLITQIQILRCRWIMACSHGIRTHVFHELQLPSGSFFMKCCAKCAEIMMKAYSLQSDLFPVKKQAVFGIG